MAFDDDPISYANETLPICHVYMPTSFWDALARYFKDNPSENECILLGHWEVKSGKPGRSNKRSGGFSGGGFRMENVSPFSSPSGVVTRRQSSSRMKHTATGASGRTSPPPSTSASANYPVSPEESRGIGQSIKDHRKEVLAIHIVGISSVASFQEVLIGEGLQVIGTVSKEMESNWRSSFEQCYSSPVLLHLFWGNDHSSIEVVSWRGQYFYPGPNRILLFYYNPEEFQRWKIPDEYPLGLPRVVLNGLSYIQTGDHQSQTDFYPVFPKVPPDYQDLHACSRIPESSFIVTNPILKFISSRSSGLQQIIHKVSILVGTLLRTYPLLPVLNFLLLLIVDSVIGYLVTRYLLQLPNMMGLLHTTVDQMLAKLNHLLKWLRGAPAGLKLNPNLNSLYWRFFSYHIHLWANYIGILEPIFAVILYTIQYFGVLGATIQISLLKDLLSLATFHVYCLYIYATRLYSLQTTAIKALCRVFFGRKFNPLRKRIDSVQLTTPELFLSSFGFVILIFLFPTTMVYYTGFVFLRVPVLLIERLLHYLVITYNKLPIISWLLVYLKSPRVADEIYLVPLTPLTHSSKVQPYQNRNKFVAFRICLQSTRTLFTPPNISGGIKSIVSCVMDGTVLKD